MILNNLRTALTNRQVSIRIGEGKIAQTSPEAIPNQTNEFQLDFNDAIVFPGLINSHDHLDFNLFPALGNRNYNNYTEWGSFIHQNYKDQINEVLKVPLELREQWGVYKNLICGVTTVVNHGKKVAIKTDLLTVYEDCQSIHSVQFEKKWKLALNNPLKKKLPVAIHSGEGTDEAAAQEIRQLSRWNFLKRELIAIHGVAMDEVQAKAFKALVWCPESNYFLLDKTASVNRLKKNVPILFGTDSTLTGGWDIWKHIRLARKTQLLTDPELYDALTINAANTWKLNTGILDEGKDADLVIAKMPPGATAGTFFDIEPENLLMVIHKGMISLFDEVLYHRLKEINLNGYTRIRIKGVCKYVKGDLPTLMQKIKGFYPQACFPVE